MLSFGDKLIFGWSDGRMYQRTLPNGTDIQRVELYGLEALWDIRNISGMFFNPVNGRVYYTKYNNPTLFWRALTPDGMLFGDFEYQAPVGPLDWSFVRGMSLVGDELYFGCANDYLFHIPWDGSNALTQTLHCMYLTCSLSTLGFTITPNDIEPSSNDIVITTDGTADIGDWQVFDFDVVAGQTIDVTITKNNPEAIFRGFLRDETRTMIVNDRDDDDVITLSTVAETTGTWSVAVKIRSGVMPYTTTISIK